MVAYQPGNAANMAAPATTSQTSLPSHSGPIVLIAARRPGSVPPSTPCSMPTPKSKPSSTKNPVHTNAMIKNQSETRVIEAAPSIQHRGDARLRVRISTGGGSGCKLAAGVANHQHRVDHRERGVEQAERNQADHQVGEADRWRHPVFGEQDALHHPGLAAALGEQP